MVIKSTGYDQEEILENIIKLHVPQGYIDLDPTYSKGNFYKSGRIQEPGFKFDLKPVRDDVVQSCATDLPLKSNSLNCINFDPPFVMGSGPSTKAPKDGSNLISQRFGMFKNERELSLFYKEALKEFCRILKDDGVLIFKCQDCVVSGKNVMSHMVIMQQAINIGFYPKDLFVLCAKSRLISGKVKNQQHARKFHSYFFVFEKKKCKVKYEELI